MGGGYLWGKWGDRVHDKKESEMPNSYLQTSARRKYSPAEGENQTVHLINPQQHHMSRK